MLRLFYLKMFLLKLMVLFFSAYEICKQFRFSYIDGKIHIILDIVKLDKHFIFYFNELLDKIIKDIKD